ncbi:hypothetical protein [Dokdonia sp. R86516]|uniref:hypothetical protein n=1 Tax=Dokdonia sp. R86516 TaxID=3093856 RepID=UPI0037C99B56
MKSPPDHFLNQIIGQTVESVYQVDFNENKDTHLPWLLLITFERFDKYLEIEGGFDGDHIKLDLNALSELNSRLKENDFKDFPDLWQVYEARQTETIGKLIHQSIAKCEYGIDKDEFIINGNIVKGQKDLFTFIRFYYNNNYITVAAGSAELSILDKDHNYLHFKDTFDTYVAYKPSS